jgi:hypothetical protein
MENRSNAKIALVKQKSEAEIVEAARLKGMHHAQETLAKDEAHAAKHGASARTDAAVAAAKATEADAVKGAVSEARKFAKQKEAEAKSDANNVLGRLDNTIMQAAKQKQAEAAALEKAMTAEKVAQDTTNKLSKAVRGLKKKLSSSSETLGNVHVQAQGHAAGAQQVKAANLKKQQETARVKASLKLAAHDTAVFNEEAARDALSIKKQETLAAALKLQQSSLEKQLKSVQATHTVYKETSSLAESDAVLSHMKAKAQIAAKNEAVKLIDRKTKALSSKTNALNKQTKSLQAEVTRHKAAAKAAKAEQKDSSDTIKKKALPAAKGDKVELIQENEGQQYEESDEALGEAVNANEAKGIRTVMKHCAFSTQRKQVKMWFVKKWNKDGSRNPRGYDNTSMLCGCVRACAKGNVACAKKCLWERGLKAA